MKQDEVIEKVVKFLFEDGGFSTIARRGNYDIDPDIFRIGFEEYLKSGKNVLDEYDKIIWLSWDTETWHFFDDVVVNEERLDEIEKTISNQGYWNVSKILNEDQIEIIKDYVASKRQLLEYRKSYQFRRRRGFTNVLKQQALERDNYGCVKCPNRTKLKLEIDHIIPLMRGGENLLENLQTLCIKCHKKKTKEDRKG